MKDKLTEQEKIALRFEAIIKANLNEKSLRLWAAAEAKAYGWGGVALVVKITRMSNRTIHRGLKELANPELSNNGRIRNKGAGRKKITETAKGITEAIEEIVNPACRGDPESPLKWSSKSTRKIKDELIKQGYGISQRTVYSLLRKMDYSLQANKKVKEGEYIAQGSARLETVNETLGTSIESEEFDSIGGFIIGELGRFPEPEEIIKHDNIEFMIEEIDKNRIKKIKILVDSKEE